MSRLAIAVETAELFAGPRRTASPLAALPAGSPLEVLEFRPRWLHVRCTPPDLSTLDAYTDGANIACVDPGARGYLAADPALQAATVEAPPGRRLAGGSGQHEVAIARAWNLYGGLLGTLADRLRFHPAAAVAVLCVESSGMGYGPDGRVLIRFENHIFRRSLPSDRLPDFDRHFFIGPGQPWMDHRFRMAPTAPWTQFHGSQALEWQAFEVARAIDPDAATRSISMGLPQVMGFNHALLGYPSARDMLAFMAADVRFQLLGLFDFVAGARRDGPALQALRRDDFDAFATLYNGPGQARYYGELIAAHVRAFQRLAPAPSPATTPPAATPPPADGAATYTVRAGDTLGAIAGRLGVTVQALATLNGLANPDLIRVGQSLRVPAADPPPPPVIVPSAPPEDIAPTGRPHSADAYIVRPGDTLGVIAARARTTVAALTRLNNLANPDLIFPGQLLRLPPPS